MAGPLAQLAPQGEIQYTDSVTGAPLAFGFVETFAAGTNNHLTTFKDALMAGANLNPTSLDNSGKCIMFLQPGLAYKFAVSDRNGVLIWTIDNIAPLDAGALIGQTLAPNVIFSSLTSVGILNSGSGGPGFIVTLTSNTVAAWLPYVPVWENTVGGASNTLGGGTITGFYLQIGKLVFFKMQLIIGPGTLSAAGAWLFSLPPVPAAQTFQDVFPATIAQGAGGAAPGNYPAIAQVLAGSTFYFYVMAAGAPAGIGGGNSAGLALVPFQWVSGSSVTVTGCYQAA